MLSIDDFSMICSKDRPLRVVLHLKCIEIMHLFILEICYHLDQVTFFENQLDDRYLWLISPNFSANQPI